MEYLSTNWRTDNRVRAVVQRVSSCRVTVETKVVGKIGNGLLVYLGIASTDDVSAADYLVHKISGLRIFEDSQEHMNLSAEDVSAEILVVSQFTLYGDTKKGKRPSYSRAAKPEIAIPLYEYCISSFTKLGFRTENGVFGAHMDVEYINSGPVTILLDTDQAL